MASVPTWVNTLYVDADARERARQESLAAYGLSRPAEDWPVDEVLAGHVRSIQAMLAGCVTSLSFVTGELTVSVSAQPACAPIVSASGSGLGAALLYAAQPGDVFVTLDARVDPDLFDHPMVTGETGSVRFCAAAPLIGREGPALGGLCVHAAEGGTAAAAGLASDVLGKVRDAVLSTLDDRRRVEPVAAGPRVPEPVRVSSAAIESVIDDCAVQTLFQPIVHLPTGEVVGFEALSRGPVGSPLESPMALLQAARDAGRLGELDWLCRTNAMRLASGSGLPPSLSWFVNVEPAGLERECPPHLRPALERARMALRVVLEIVERDVHGHVTRFLRAADQARGDAWGVALDHVGTEVGSLAMLPFFHPDVVKLDMSLLRRAPGDEAAEITAAVRAYAERTGTSILAEGIETDDQARLAAVFGATYGQGYRYGRPGPLPALVPVPDHPIPLRQNPDALTGGTPFELVRSRIRPQRGRPADLEHILGHLWGHCARETDSAVLFVLTESEERYQERRNAIDLLAGTNAFTVCLTRDGRSRRDEPRHHVAPLPAGSALAPETAVIVVTPHYAGALLTRAHGDEVDYIYTHDRDAVTSAGRAILDHMQPTGPR